MDENYYKNYYIKNIRKFREYYDNNKDSIADYAKLYYQQNKVQIRERQRAYFHEYYLLNKDTIQERSYRRYHEQPYKRDYAKTQINQSSLLKQNIIIRLIEC
jgi:hypothetical protein